MHMAQAATRWTAAMVRALPEDRKRYEVIGGELIVSPGPSWTHQRAVALLMIRLHNCLEHAGTGSVLGGPADIEFSSDTLVQPDLFVVPLVGGKVARRWEDVNELLLVVEVLSPSSARTDRMRKRELYLSRGAPEYWVVDADARLIERWRSGETRPELVADSIELWPSNAAEPFAIDVGEYFREVMDG